MTSPDPENPENAETPLDDGLTFDKAEDNQAVPASEEEVETEDQEDDDGGEEEEGDGKTGKKGGGGGRKVGGKKHEQEPEEGLLSEEEDLSAYDSESLIEKLKLLAWAPFSTIVPGASAFDSENDLKRKLFLGEIGLLTNDLEGLDIADPQLIQKLEARLQERKNQEQLAARTAATVAAGVAVVAGAAAGVAAMPPLPTAMPDPAPQVAAAAQKNEDPAKRPAQSTPVKNPMQREDAQRNEDEKIRQDDKLRQEKLMQYGTAMSQKNDGGDLFIAAEIMNQLQPQQDPSFADEVTPDAAPPAQPDAMPASPVSIASFFNIASSDPGPIMAQDKMADFKVADPAPKVDLPSMM